MRKSSGVPIQRHYYEDSNTDRPLEIYATMRVRYIGMDRDVISLIMRRDGRVV